MRYKAQVDGPKGRRVTLGLLESLERDGAQSQRRLAADLDVALGLVNTYLKRCIKKGLVKMRHAPARRYFYYLTPQGFAEKSRLTIDYLTDSLSLFRKAKADCTTVFEQAERRGFKRIVLAGRSEITEIAALCALESTIEIVGVIDDSKQSARLASVPVVSSFEELSGSFDAVIITALADAAQWHQRALDSVRPDRVLVPDLLRLELDAVALEPPPDAVALRKAKRAGRPIRDAAS